MFDTPRSFIDTLGGYRLVAKRMRVSPTTLHSHLTAGALPPKWFSALRKLASEAGVHPPPEALFSFETLAADEPSTLEAKGRK